MFILLQSSQVTVPVWLAILLPVFSASVPIIVSFIGRKRRSSVRAENDKVAAEATRLNVESITSLVQELRETRADLTKQLIWHENISVIARKAAHAAVGEVQRCVIAIHLRDETIKEAAAAIECVEAQLTENKITFTKTKLTEVPPFTQTKHADIVNYQALPLPPKSEP